MHVLFVPGLLSGVSSVSNVLFLAPCRCFDVSSKIIYWVGGKTVGFLDIQVGIVVYNTPAWGLSIYIYTWLYECSSFFQPYLGCWLRWLICVGWVETTNQYQPGIYIWDIRYKWDIIFDYSHTKWDSAPRSVPLNVLYGSVGSSSTRQA